MVPLSRPAAADQLSDARAKAAQISAQIRSAGQQIDALGQQYSQAQAQVASLTTQISATQARIDATRRQVAHDEAVLQKAAVNAYISSGQQSSQNPLFSSNQSSVAAANVYGQVAEGDISTAVDNLHTAQATLAAQQNSLQSQEQQAAAAKSAAGAAVSRAQSAQAQLNSALSQENGQISQLVAQQQQAAAAAATAAAQQRIKNAQAAAAAQAAASRNGTAGNAGASASTNGNGGPPSYAPPPPPAAGGAGAIAVAAAESYLGVPYVWAGASRSGVDCSGLTMLAWAAAGVSLPHYSGGQMAASTPVPISDLQPGDLLFYGPGGSQHVAMYIGGGSMIEAPYTGAVVRITGVRFGDGFVGAGRP